MARADICWSQDEKKTLWPPKRQDTEASERRMEPVATKTTVFEIVGVRNGDRRRSHNRRRNRRLYCRHEDGKRSL